MKTNENLINSIKTTIWHHSAPVVDISLMHRLFRVNEAVAKLDNERLRDFLEFRIKCMLEEMNEILEAEKGGDADGVVDGIIDIIVFAIGTLDLFGVNFNKAWNEVLIANLSKSPGIKPGRPNPYGLPDLIKPDNFVSPDHSDNLGKIADVLSPDNI